MTVLAILAVFPLCFPLAIKYADYSYRDWWQFAMFGLAIIGIFSTFGFLGAIICVPANHYDCHRNIAKFHAARDSFEESRKRDDYEAAALQQEIAEWNVWLAGVKFDNARLWDIWIPDEVNSLEPIK